MPKRVIIPLILVFGTAFIVTFVYIIMPLLPATRHRYKDYKTFRQKTRTEFLTDVMPDSAEPEYYYHSLLFNRESGYRVQLSDNDYDLLKKDAQERYLSNKKTWTQSGSLYIGSSDGAAGVPDYSEFEKEGLGFIKEDLVRSDEGFYLLYDFEIDNSEMNDRFGMMCNDKTNEIIEYYRRKAKPN